MGGTCSKHTGIYYGGYSCPKCVEEMTTEGKTAAVLDKLTKLTREKKLVWEHKVGDFVATYKGVDLLINSEIHSNLSLMDDGYAMYTWHGGVANLRSLNDAVRQQIYEGAMAIIDYMLAEDEDGGSDTNN